MFGSVGGWVNEVWTSGIVYNASAHYKHEYSVHA